MVQVPRRGQALCWVEQVTRDSGQVTFPRGVLDGAIAALVAGNVKCHARHASATRVTVKCWSDLDGTKCPVTVKHRSRVCKPLVMAAKRCVTCCIGRSQVPRCVVQAAGVALSVVWVANKRCAPAMWCKCLGRCCDYYVLLLLLLLLLLLFLHLP